MSNNDVLRNLPPSKRLSWTFTLWLASQRERKDRIGVLGRRVEEDVVWPGHRSLAGLEEYMRRQGSDEKTIGALHRAYEEYEKWKQGGDG